jgi:hypothetical protein
MSNVLLGWNNRADSATLTADVAFSTSLPLSNLSTDNINTVARTGSIKPSATRFRCAFGANYTLRALGIRNHTLSTRGRWRVRVGRSPFDLLFDSEDTGGILDSRLTKSGGTNGTRVNKNGYIVPVTRTNLALQSQTLGTTWTVTGVTVTANQVSAPDNTTTSDKLDEGTGASAHTLTQTFSATSGVTYAYSFHVKDGDRRYVQLSFASASHGANAWANFDLQEGELGDVGSAVLRADIQPAGAGHWRILIVAPATATTASGSIDLSLVTSAQATRALSYTGTSKYVYAWGAQLEEGGDWTTYIPTTTVAVQSTESGRIGYGTFRTNFLSWSENFAKSTWGKSNCSVSGGEVDPPSGVGTAFAVRDDAVNSTHGPNNGSANAIPHGATLTLSCYVKVLSASRWIRLRVTNGAGTNGFHWLFNPSTGASALAAAAVGSGTVVGSPQITALADGWYRVSVSGTLAATDTTSSVQLLMQNQGAIYNATYIGDGSGIYLAGAQLEASASVSAYIATTFAARTVVDSCSGLLVEEARTNLLLQSAFRASWTATAATLTANALLTRDGSKSGASLIEDNTNATHGITQSVVKAASAIQYATSVYVRPLAAGSARNLKLQIDDGGANGVYVIVNPTTGATVQAPLAFGAGWTAGSLTVSAAGDGWYRVAFDATSNTAVTVRAVAVLADGTTVSYIGDATSGLYLWGAQLEAGAFATNHIPTTTASVTLTVDGELVTGSSFSGFYNQPAGTLYAEFTSPASGTRPILSLDDNTANEQIRLYTSGTSLMLTVTDGGVTQANITIGTIAANTAYKVAVAWQANDFAACLSGGVVSTDSAGTIPTVDRLRIGSDQAGNVLCGPVKRPVYWPERLKNSELISITTSGPDAIGYNSGWVDALQFTFNGDEPSAWGEQYDLLTVTSADVTAGYATVEFDDLYNTAAYLDLGRLYAMGGLQPAYNVTRETVSDGREDLSSVSRTVTGRTLGTQRARRRQAAFAFRWLDQDEANTWHEALDDLGLMGEVLYVPDPADAALSQRYGFLGELEQLGPIEYPYVNTRATAVRIKEKL